MSSSPTGPGASGPGEDVFWRSRAWWARASHTALGVWAAAVMAILTTVVAARALGPEGYGSVILAIAVATSVSTFLDVTFEEATVFHGNRALASGDLAGLLALLKTSLKVDIGIGILVAGAIFALADPLADVVSGGRLDPTLVRIAAISILVTTADSTAYAALALARRVDLRARGMAATAAFRLVGAVVAVQVGGAEELAVSYTVGGAAGSLVLGGLAWRVGWREWKSESRPGARPVGILELVRFAFHTSLNTSVQAVSGTLVPVMLGAAAGPAAVGIFRVAMLPLIASRNLSGPVRLVTFPEQARLVAEGRTAEIRRATKGYAAIGLGVGSVVAVVAWFALPWAIPLLYSSSFEASITPARILLIAAVVHFTLGWRKTLLAALGRPEIRTRLVMVNLVVVVSLLLVIADRGAEGAAIAVSSGVVATGIAWLIIMPRVLSEESLLARRAPPRTGSREGRRTPPTMPEQDLSGARR